ncbi:MAG: methyltransferase domain-containing protein [Opitutales bacterium]|nr:methyltransferase domain-containing protein [Opitutales bacterium]
MSWPEPVEATGRLTELAHARLAAYVRTGDTVLDATAGNGHDTAFLARHAGPSGHVYAMDIQKAALESARKQSAPGTRAAGITWIAGDHARLIEHLPRALVGNLRAAVFNLGYLPGGDHSVTTRAPSTCAALESALAYLAAGGVLCVTCYRGHPGGEEEYSAVLEWMKRRRHRFARAWRHIPQNRRLPPVLLIAEKQA